MKRDRCYCCGHDKSELLCAIKWAAFGILALSSGIFCLGGVGILLTKMGGHLLKVMN